MFTGIVSHVGHIVDVAPLQEGKRITVDVGAWDISDVGLGDSILHSGCCLTVVAINGRTLSYDISAHTLTLTIGLGAPGPVNLEKSLRLADRLGGHLVTGHIDCTARVVKFERIAESWYLEIDVPREHARYIARKGSVCVNGVSLTVNAVDGTAFQCNIIPHTYAHTTFNTMKPGDRANIEVDLLARYVERMLSTTQGGSQPL